MPGEFRKTELIDGVVVTTHTVDDSHAGWRADNFLRVQYHYFSRNKLQSLIAEGRIVITRLTPGEQRLKPSTTLYAGDQLRVLTEKAEEPAVDVEYQVLFEDDHILVVDKPGNLPVHPAGKFLFNTLLMVLRKKRQDWLDAGGDFFLIHRLDRETSGVILIAKTSEAAGHLVKEFRERRTEKHYLAIAEGVCANDSFSVDADIGSAIGSHIRLKMAAFPKGTGEMDALTHFKVLKRHENVTLLNCQLETGRQHQIRVHLASVGHPVVGDKLYGPDDEIFLDHIYSKPLTEQANASLKISRHALHSRYLRFYHHLAGRWMEVESRLPKDMEALLK